MYLRKIGLFLAVIIFVAGCAVKIEKPIEKPVEKAKFPLVLVSSENVPSLVDDLQWVSLNGAVERSIRYFDKVKANVTYHLDNDEVSGRDMKESLLTLNEILASSDSEEMKADKLKEAFDFYKAAGTDGKGTVLFTGYYEPILYGSLKMTGEYRYPIYRTPQDLVAVNLGNFKEEYRNEKIISKLKQRQLIPYFIYKPLMECSLEMTGEYGYPVFKTRDDTVVVNLEKFSEKYRSEKIIGKLKNKEFIPYVIYEPVMACSQEKEEGYGYPIYKTFDHIRLNLEKFSEKYRNEKIIGRLKNKELVPYFTREDIEKRGSLAGKNMELLWVNDPVDLFFMHIQGSGKVRLPDGRLIHISYAQSNGHPNRMTNYLFKKKKLSGRQMGYKSIKKYLREHPEELSDIFNYNASYVFFRTVEEGPIGALGLTLTAGRSIATDLNLFPRGALAFIRLRKPVFDDDGNIKTWQPYSRFVLNQDTGGVIKGPGRVDLFCGTGSDAEMFAGSLKEKGELYFLVKKKADNQ